MRISDWSSDVCSSDLPAKFLSEFGQWDFEVEERYNHKGEDRIRWPHRQNKIGQVSQGSKKTGVENSGIDFIPSLRRKFSSIRSEERRVGKECVRTCRSRWSPYL